MRRTFHFDVVVEDDSGNNPQNNEDKSTYEQS